MFVPNKIGWNRRHDHWAMDSRYGYRQTELMHGSFNKFKVATQSQSKFDCLVEKEEHE